MRRGAVAPDGLQALQAALANAHDVLIHTAAKLQARAGVQCLMRVAAVGAGWACYAKGARSKGSWALPLGAPLPTDCPRRSHQPAAPPPRPPQQALDDRVSAAREADLARRRAAGDFSNPFEEEERRQAKHAEHQPRGPAAQAAALQAAQQQHGGQAAAAPATTTLFAAAPAQPAASPQGLFGTVAPSLLGGGAFGTPLAQGQTPPSSRRSSRRR